MLVGSPAFVPAESIDEVIARLDAIIHQAIIERDRLGFFAVLYRTVTVAVQAGIAAGRFDDGPRMERLDIVFANRYLEAFHTHRSGATPSKSWSVADSIKATAPPMPRCAWPRKARSHAPPIFGLRRWSDRKQAE